MSFTLAVIYSESQALVCLQSSRSSIASHVFGVMSVRDIRAESLAEKRRQQEVNPCFDEEKKSLKCVELNGNDSDQCWREIENVKICRSFWYEIYNCRKREGIEPHLPPPRDRQDIKEIYLKTGSVRRICDDMKRQSDL